ncbi:hypothetical protein BH20ACI3_BH20ACI3_17850 [soil metagenome]
MRRRILIAIVASFSLLAPATGQQQGKHDEVVRVTTNLVQVDVVVTDKDGKQVTDLRPEELEILEDNRKQPITNFSYIASGSNRFTSTESGHSEDKKPAVVSPASLSPEQMRRTMVIVVDDLGLSFESTISVREALKKFVGEQMQIDDRVAIIRTSKGVGTLQQFTSEKPKLLAAIDNIRWYAMGRGGITPFAPMDTQQNSDFTQGQQLLEELEETRQSHYSIGSFGTLSFVLQGLAEIPGRKSVLMISESFRLFTSQGRNTQLLDFLRRLTDLANRSSTVIYTLDAAGLNPLSFTAEDRVSGSNFDPTMFRDTNSPGAVNRTRSRRSDVSASAAAQAEQDSSAAFRRLDALANQRESQNVETHSVLSFLAAKTGGLFVRNTNDLSAGTQRMLGDQKGYYLIGYRPEDSVIDPATGQRRIHNLTVKVKRSGLRVRAREGYYGVTTEERSAAKRTREAQLVAALTSPFASGDVGIRVTPVFGNDQGEGSYLRVLLHVNTRDLTFTDQPDGSHSAVLDIVAVSTGESERVMDQFSDTQTINVKSETYPSVLENGLTFVLNVPIKQSGAYQLRVAVRDAPSQRTGSASQFIEVPDLNKPGLRLSGILINGTEEAPGAGGSGSAPAAAPTSSQQAGSNGRNELNPQAGPAVRRLKQGMILNYIYTIYNAQVDSVGRPKLQTQMRLFREGKEVFTGRGLPYNVGQQMDLKRLKAGGRFLVGNNLAPGEYILQVTVTDTLARDRRNIAFQWIDLEIIR